MESAHPADDNARNAAPTATLLPPPPAKPTARPKFAGPVQKECYGTFREDFGEEKKDECFTCSKYVECIQISFKSIRLRRVELEKLVAILRRREVALAAQGGMPTTASGRARITHTPTSGRHQALSASA